MDIGPSCILAHSLNWWSGFNRGCAAAHLPQRKVSMGFHLQTWAPFWKWPLICWRGFAFNTLPTGEWKPFCIGCQESIHYFNSSWRSSCCHKTCRGSTIHRGLTTSCVLSLIWGYYITSNISLEQHTLWRCYYRCCFHSCMGIYVPRAFFLKE